MTAAPRRLRARCFAKINTVLRVVTRRADGFHELDTEFVPLALHDTLDVEEARGFDLRVVGMPPEEVPVDDNLVLRAARSLQAEVGAERLPGARFVLRKWIPAAAGLGGGSSDAATALEALDRLHSLGMPRAKMAELALAVGSDVPYFLLGGRQRGRGRGELLEGLPDRPSVGVLLLKPRLALPTALVFRMHAAMVAAEPGRAFGRSLTRRKNGTTVIPEAWWASPDWVVHDDLADAAVSLAPEVGVVARVAEEAIPGALIGMTGSGPTIFALCAGDVLQAEKEMRRRLPDVDSWATRTISAAEYAATRFE